MRAPTLDAAQRWSRSCTSPSETSIAARATPASARPAASRGVGRRWRRTSAAGAPGSRPSAASPSVPVTRTRSPARAPLRSSARPSGTAPMAVTVTDSSAARVTFPPATAIRWRRAQAPRPRAIRTIRGGPGGRRHAQAHERPQRPRAHRGEVGEVHRERLPADVLRREPAVEVDSRDDGVGGRDELLAGGGREHGRVVARADAHALARERQGLGEAADELELAGSRRAAHPRQEARPTAGIGTMGVYAGATAGRSGRIEGEGRARAGGGADTHLAAVRLDEALHDGEPEPGAAVLAGRRAVHLVEDVEDLAEVLLGDADTAVLHVDREPVAGERLARRP